MFADLAEFSRSLTQLRFLQVSALLCALALFLSYRTFGRLTLIRLIDGTPTQKVRSCTQGYAELAGQAVMLSGEEIRSPGGRRCVWFRSRLLSGPPPDESGSREELKYEGLGLDASRFGIKQSDHLLGIVDDTGLCIVDPEGAEILPSTRQRRLTLNGYPAVEHFILENDHVYVIGHFETPDVAGLTHDRRTEIAARVGHWKKTAFPELVAEFDGNGDGELDQDEWTAVREHAKQTVAAEYRQRAFGKEVHLMRNPDGGRKYLIAASTEGALTKGTRREMWLGFAVAFLSLCCAFFLFAARTGM